MTATESGPLHFTSLVDKTTGRAFVPNLSVYIPRTEVPEEIAPWNEPPSPIPPSPPPKSAGRSLGFLHPNSRSISPALEPSTSASSFVRINGGSSSTASVPDEYTLRKSKASLFSKVIPKSLKSRFRSGSTADTEHPSLKLPPPPLPDHTPFLPVGPSSPQHPSFGRSIRKGKGKRKGATGSLTNRSTTNPNGEADLPPLPSEVMMPVLDTNIDEMDGIVEKHSLAHSRTYSSDNSFSSRSFASGSTDFSLAPIPHPHFKDPFATNNGWKPTPRGPAMNKLNSVERKVSPKTARDGPTYVTSASLDNEPLGADPSWAVPESWAITKDDEDPSEEEYSSSEDSLGGGRPMEFRVSNRNTDDLNDSELGYNPYTHSVGTFTGGDDEKTKKRIFRAPAELQPNVLRKHIDPAQRKYTIRIYRANNTYHVISVGFGVTVASIMSKLRNRLLMGEDREPHRLYLKEKGRERVLAQMERPADIVRRRLEQAGYDISDGLKLLGGDGLSFLLKFVYKSQLLGPAEEDIKIPDYTSVDLSGRSLRTIPVSLYAHTYNIVSLILSRNPMLEIPLDFIQSCTTLRELRLSHMAMKRVPNSIKSSSTLLRLDISCNRIPDLDEAYLDKIPGLMGLFAQNNKMEKLSWYFPRLRSLVTLNISNNKFRAIPRVLCELENLRDLDISFNMIQELPEEIGQLRNLERFIIIGNQVSKFPAEMKNLVSLRYLDCRRNSIGDLAAACMLPNLETLSADHNVLYALDLSLGPKLKCLDVSHNEITKLSLTLRLADRTLYALTTLDISYARLSSLDDLVLAQLTTLRTLRLDHNRFSYIPETLGELQFLETLNCANNVLSSLPASIGRLQRLEILDVHCNNLTDVPVTLWDCVSLYKINFTSNMLVAWPAASVSMPHDASMEARRPGRNASTASLITRLPPLAYSLQKLYLGENHLIDDVLHPLTILRELQVLNLSFNDLRDLPPNFFKNFSKLEELYLSGNKLSSIPTEDLPKLTRLSVLYLNANRLQTLPQELGKVMSLTVFDVGSNLLKYNINNWEFDWNWNFNKNLKYLNLSGNKRLQIKADNSRLSEQRFSRDSRRQTLAGFTDLTQLRVLGLMDVTVNANVDIPNESDDRRVRASPLTVCDMSYGISDTLGKDENLHMIDLVHEFPGRQGEVVFAMFGRAYPPKQIPTSSSNQLAKYLCGMFTEVLLTQMHALDPEQNEGIPDAMRRAFLKLNQDFHDAIFSTRKMSQTVLSVDPQDIYISRNGASGVVLYFIKKKLCVANAGNALAVISRSGSAILISQKHDPYDRNEIQRIRAAEGWVSPLGLVNDEIDVSRSFGFFHLLPLVNARPYVQTWDLTEHDEFIIVGNRSLWDYVSFQTAVDIARREIDTMIAAQKLRDLAMGYGADGSTMVMVIGVSDLFKSDRTFSTDPYGGLLQPPRSATTDHNISQAIQGNSHSLVVPNMHAVAEAIAQPLDSHAVASLIPLVDEYLSKRMNIKSFLIQANRLFEWDRRKLRKLFRLFKCEEKVFFPHETATWNLDLAIVTTKSRGNILVFEDSAHARLDGHRILNTNHLRTVIRAGRASADEIILNLTRPWAACIMELLQIELGLPHLHNELRYRKQCMHYLRRLSKIHGILPPSFYVHDIVRIGSNALYGGGFADVWKGEVDGQQVCLKVLRLFTTTNNKEKILRQFCREALVWKQLNHPNVLPFLGVSTELFAPSFCLISPWISHGTLMMYLEKHPEFDRSRAIIEIAEAMGYLHDYDPPIVHADIRGANVLVCDDLRCCLGDFGLASITESFSSTSGTSVNTHGALRWMAPEAIMSTVTDHDDTEHIEPDKCSRDIYAFACTVLEIFTGKPPFGEFKDGRVLKEVLDGHRPARPPGVFSDDMWSLVEECWAQDPSRRPSAQNIIASLNPLQMPSTKQMWTLGMLCLRLEALAADRAFKVVPKSKGNFSPIEEDVYMENGQEEDSLYMQGDPYLRMPPINEDSDLMFIMDSLVGRIEDAIASLSAEANTICEGS